LETFQTNGGLGKWENGYGLCVALQRSELTRRNPTTLELRSVLVAFVMFPCSGVHSFVVAFVPSRWRSFLSGRSGAATGSVCSMHHHHHHHVYVQAQSSKFQDLHGCMLDKRVAFGPKIIGYHDLQVISEHCLGAFDCAFTHLHMSGSDGQSIVPRFTKDCIRLTRSGFA